jgi:hypothetical protein
MASSVECIKSMIILAGSILMEKHFDNAIDDGVLFAMSESGYSNAYLGIEWLKHFDGQTAGRRKGKYLGMGATLRTSLRITLGSTTLFCSDCLLIQRIYCSL